MVPRNSVSAENTLLWTPCLEMPPDLPDGWMEINDHPTLGKWKSSWFVPQEGLCFLYSCVLMFCFYVSMFFLNQGYFWIHYVIAYVLMSLVYTGYLSGLWNLLSRAVLCIFDGGGVQQACSHVSLIFFNVPFQQVTFQQRPFLLVVSTTRCKKIIVSYWHWHNWFYRFTI